MSTTTSSLPLNLVALGDSLPYAGQQDCPGCTSFAFLYGRDLERATSRPVTARNDSRHNSLNSAGLLDIVRTDAGVRADIAAADAILITIGHNDTPWVLIDDPCDGADSALHAQWDRYNAECTGILAQRLQQNIDAVLSEITTLRGSKPTIVRVTNFYNDNMKDPTADPGGDKSSQAVVDAYSAAICAAAKGHGLPCADIYHAFNGPTGDQSDIEFVGADHVHPSQNGHTEIARVLAALGYKPLA